MMVHAMLKISTPPKLTEEDLYRIQNEEYAFLDFVCAIVEKDSFYFKRELILKGIEEGKITNIVNDLVEDFIPIRALIYAYETLLGYSIDPLSILHSLQSSDDIILKKYGRYVTNAYNEVCLTFTDSEKYGQDLCSSVKGLYNGSN